MQLLDLLKGQCDHFRMITNPIRLRLKLQDCQRVDLTREPCSEIPSLRQFSNGSPRSELGKFIRLGKFLKLGKFPKLGKRPRMLSEENFRGDSGEALCGT